jgi:nitroreductase
MYSNDFQEIVNFRRSNRKFDPDINMPDEVMEKSLERAILSPNSINMQLWEFYWIKSKDAGVFINLADRNFSVKIRFLGINLGFAND